MEDKKLLSTDELVEDEFYIIRSTRGDNYGSTYLDGAIVRYDGNWNLTIISVPESANLEIISKFMNINHCRSLIKTAGDLIGVSNDSYLKFEEFK
jgi:hypothetical protein